jgi:hypothetical protein
MFRIPALLLCLIAGQAVAQVRIHGVVTDAGTGRPLSAATIQIPDTYRGTVANSEGAFELTVPDLPVTLIVRFIGYDSRMAVVGSPQDLPLRISLRPVEYQLREVVVTGEDPAVDIMRQVIARKQIWRQELTSYQAEAYTRQRLENDTSIISISESLSDAYWDRFMGTREVIRYKNQTSNIDPSSNFAAATFIPNLYDDNITISGFDLVGPTHPDALSYYHMKLEGFRMMDGQTVFDISIRPKNRLQPTFVGMLSILDEEFAMIHADVVPSESVMFPPPIQEFGLHYIQQFRNFGNAFWLPVDVRIEGTIRIGFPGLNFPPFRFWQLSRLDNYQVNAGVPEFLFQNTRRLMVDSAAVALGNPGDRLGMAIPLDQREWKAYETVDSTMTLEKAFRPTGPLARFVSTRERDGSETSNRRGPFSRLNGLTPLVRYNRVAGVDAGLAFETPETWAPVDIRVFGRYAFSAEEAGYGLRLATRNRTGWNLNARHEAGIESRFQESRTPEWLSGVGMVLSNADHFDHYRSEMTALGVSYDYRKPRERRRRRSEQRLFDRFTTGLEVRQEVVDSRPALVSYSLPGGITQRPNPAVNDGTYPSLAWRFSTETDRTPFGVTGERYLDLDVEFGEHHTRVHAVVAYRFETFLRRRFLPNVLDLTVMAGTGFGTIPAHRLHQAEGSVSAFRPYGQLRTVSGPGYEGQHAIALHWEHHFRTVPFELVGWESAAKNGVGMIIFGSHAAAWTDAATRAALPFQPSGTNGHHEAGVSLTGLFGFLRVDAAYRIDQPGFYGGIGFARIF